jgi:CheY-like chemotaxis protein
MSPLIIIIDDDPVSSKIAEISILRKTPHIKTRIYNNPIEALQNITSEYEESNTSQEVLLLIDINMPEMSGWEFVESLNEKIPFQGDNLKGIILSSSVDPADIEKSKQYPRIVHYLTKPFTLDTALTIQQWI